MFVSFRRLKTRAARAMREIKKMVRARMDTTDVNLSPNLNKFIWSRGIKAVPPKVRLVITRKLKETDKKRDKGKCYCTVDCILETNFNKLRTKRVSEEGILPSEKDKAK